MDKQYARLGVTSSIRLHDCRKRLGLTLKELGERVNLTAAAISQYELGKRRIPYSVARRLAAALGINVTELLPIDLCDCNDIVIGADTDYESRMLLLFDSLTEYGKSEAIKRVSELARLDEYKKQTKTENEE